MKIIIMAGGSGTRLWPLSRGNCPKQFIKLIGADKSIFQLTLLRCLALAGIEDVSIVTNGKYHSLVSAQIEELGYPVYDENILLEPMAKSTLPAIYNGVRHIRKRGEDVVGVFTSDHLIPDVDSFARQVRAAAPYTDRFLITFGIVPDRPETGYGYIKPGKVIEQGGHVESGDQAERIGAGSETNSTAYIVDEFKEKPERSVAERYVRDGYYWNSGMFIFHTGLFSEEVMKYSPGVYSAFQNDSVEECFAQSPSISIDYGIMEKSDRVAVIPLIGSWSDVGSFATFYDEYKARVDCAGNILFGEPIMIDSVRNLVYAEGGKAVGLIGVSDLVVIDQGDALLICHKDKAQLVDQVVDQLRRRGDSRADQHKAQS